jgi:hypothetical protein
VVRAHCNQTSGELTSTIFQEMDRYSTTAFDDQTVFVMKVKPAGSVGVG